MKNITNREKKTITSKRFNIPFFNFSIIYQNLTVCNKIMIKLQIKKL